MARSYKMTKLILDSLIGDTSTLVLDAMNHRVGIGTETPNKLLSVAGDIEIGMGLTGTLWNYNSTRTQYSSLELYNVSNGNVTLKTTVSGANIYLTSGTSGKIITNKALTVGTDLTVGGKIVETKTSQTLTANTNEISSATSYVALNYSGNITLITNEVIDTEGAVDGQILHVVNAGTDSVITLTCWVAGASEYSKVTAKGGAASIALTRNATNGKADSATFIFNSTIGRWIQL